MRYSAGPGEPATEWQLEAWAATKPLAGHFVPAGCARARAAVALLGMCAGSRITSHKTASVTRGAVLSGPRVAHGAGAAADPAQYLVRRTLDSEGCH